MQKLTFHVSCCFLHILLLPLAFVWLIVLDTTKNVLFRLKVFYRFKIHASFFDPTPIPHQTSLADMNANCLTHGFEKESLTRTESDRSTVWCGNLRHKSFRSQELQDPSEFGQKFQHPNIFCIKKRVKVKGEVFNFSAFQEPSSGGFLAFFRKILDHIRPCPLEVTEHRHRSSRCPEVPGAGQIMIAFTCFGPIVSI